jgi:hypothetical protein
VLDRVEQLRPATVDLLRVRSTDGRGQYLSRLRHLVPLWCVLAPTGTAGKIANQVIEVCWEWQWE